MNFYFQLRRSYNMEEDNVQQLVILLDKDTLCKYRENMESLGYDHIEILVDVIESLNELAERRRSTCLYKEY